MNLQRELDEFRARSRGQATLESVSCRWLVLWTAMSALAAPPAYQSARRKLDIIESGKAPAGAVYGFSKAEIEAWAEMEIPREIPKGVRKPAIELGSDRATGTALVNFAEVRHAQGAAGSWILDRLLDGERLVIVKVRLSSAHGRCTAYLDELNVGGVKATGPVLDFLVRNFFFTLFPAAKVGEPFELPMRIDSVAIRPLAAYVRIGK